MRRPSLSMICLGASLLGFVALPFAAHAVTIGADIVVKQGDTVGSGTVSTLNAPFTDSAGHVGFVGALSDGQRFIWWNDGPVFFSNDALPDVLIGGEGTMGVSNAGGFIYSPSVNGNDAVYTHGGTLLQDGEPVPCLPGLYSTYNSRPTMLPNGVAYWCGGTATTSGGSTSNRHLFRATDPTDSTTIERVLGGGDVIEGKTVKPTATNFTYWISDNGLHHIHVLDMNVTLNEHLYLDGQFVAQEGSPTGQGDNWSGFDSPSVNNSGDYLFAGDTDGATATDYFVAYNGVIGLREGDTVSGVTLPSGATVRAASLNNQGKAVFIWGLSETEWLFCADATALSDAELILATGDSLDVDGNEEPDYILTDFNASGVIGPGLDFSDDPFVYVDVDITPIGGTSLQAILRVRTQLFSAVDAGAAPELRAVFSPCVPDPCSGPSRIRFAVSETAPVRITVFDVAGRCVRNLHEGIAAAGPHELIWDGRAENGARVAPGIYFLRLDSPAGAQQRKLARID
jgi:hypothetical protein